MGFTLSPSTSEVYSQQNETMMSMIKNLPESSLVSNAAAHSYSEPNTQYKPGQTTRTYNTSANLKKLTEDRHDGLNSCKTSTTPWSISLAHPTQSPICSYDEKTFTRGWILTNPAPSYQTTFFSKRHTLRTTWKPGEKQSKSFITPQQPDTQESQTPGN
jgi:hypothetical protein